MEYNRFIIHITKKVFLYRNIKNTIWKPYAETNIESYYFVESIETYIYFCSWSFYLHYENMTHILLSINFQLTWILDISIER